MKTILEVALALLIVRVVVGLEPDTPRWLLFLVGTVAYLTNAAIGTKLQRKKRGDLDGPH